jgi:hypothetical protein
MKKIAFFRFFLALAIIFFTSCSYQKSSYHNVAKNIQIPIFISLPKNLIVFENVSPIVYKGIWGYFHNLGYNLVNNDKNAYALTIKIKSLEPTTKYISSDVILYSMEVKMELECTAFDKNKKQIAQKKFNFFTLISKPQNTILNPGVFEYEYARLVQRAAPKIEQYFRKYWIKKT